jgi:proline iminopeptidase
MRIKIGDSWLFFDVEGAKLRPDGPRMKEVPTLLLLHGGPGFDHSTFKPAMSALADVAQLVYLDHRGQGRSDRVSSDQCRIAAWADDVKDFCDALEITRPLVLGHSFGGVVTMVYATRHPSHPAKIILSSTTARIRRDRIYEAFERLGGNRARAAAERFWEDPGAATGAEYEHVCFPLYSRSGALADPDVMSRMIFNHELELRFFQGEGRTFDFMEELHRIECPTLLLAGEDDPVTPLEDAADIARHIAPSLLRFVRFADAGHGVFRDVPKSSLQVIREFISG